MIVIVASSELWPTPEVMGSVGGVIAAIDEPVGIRASQRGLVASMIEEAAVKICHLVDREVDVFQPITGEGRAGVFERDYRLVEKASKVFAWFAPGEEMDGGTGHVVKAALDRGVAVEAYRLDNDGNVELFGSEDGTW